MQDKIVKFIKGLAPFMAAVDKQAAAHEVTAQKAGTLADKLAEDMAGKGLILESVKGETALALRDHVQALQFLGEVVKNATATSVATMGEPAVTKKASARKDVVNDNELRLLEALGVR